MAKKQKNVKNASTPKSQSTQGTYKARVNAMQNPQKPSKWFSGTVLSIALISVGLITAALLLINMEGDVLFRSQEMNLWMPGDTFYKMFSIYPGGWLSWAGSYMTDFFYHPALGVAMLVAAWALIVGLIATTYRLRGWKLLLTAAVPILLLAALTQTGYWVYYQKLHGHLWVPTLAMGISVLAAHITHKITQRLSTLVGAIIRMVLIVPFAWYGYQAMGMWSFASVLLMAFPTGLPTVKTKPEDEDTPQAKQPSLLVPSIISFLPVLVAAACIFFVPRIAYDNIYEQTIIGEIYRAGMPTFHYGFADLYFYRTPYYLLALSFIPILAAGWIKDRVWQQKLYRILGAAAIIGVLGYSLYTLKDRWNRDQNFHIEVAMNNAIDRQDWQGTLDALTNGIKVDTIAPTRAMVMMKNLALYRQGRIGNDMFNYPEGSRLQNVDEYYKYGNGMYPDSIFKNPDLKQREYSLAKHRWNIRLSQIAGKKMYYNYGKLNFCYRWCMEDAVEFGWRVDDMKMMALCAMFKGEDIVARKYFNMLKQTRYHGEWVQKYEKFLGKFDAMRADEELKPITYLMQYGDRLDGDNTLIEMYLLQTFANGNGVDPYYQEMTLVSALLMKDIQLFWPRFFRYAEMHKSEKDFHMPRVYQEAAYLYGHLENNIDISKLPFDPIVKQTYEQFMAFNNRRDIAPLSEEEKAKVFAPQFSHTFYYFYFLRRNQKTN